MKNSKQTGGVEGGGKIVFASIIFFLMAIQTQGQIKTNKIGKNQTHSQLGPGQIIGPGDPNNPSDPINEPLPPGRCTPELETEMQNPNWRGRLQTTSNLNQRFTYWLGRDPNTLINESYFLGINKASPASVLDIHYPQNQYANARFGITVSTGECAHVGLVAGDQNPSWVGSYYPSNLHGQTNNPFQVRAGLAEGGVWDPNFGTFIHLNPSNERIGINTATPAATLDVNGDAKADNLKLTQVPEGLVGINGSGMISPATSGQVGQLMFANLSADFIPKMGANAALENSSLINTSSGRIGFGIANPLARFHFKHPTSNFSPDFLGNRENEMLRFSNQWNGNNTDLGITFDNGVTPQEIQVAWKVTAGVAGGNRFRIRNIITTPNPNEEPIIEDKTLISMNGANGNVGIGTEPVGTHRLLVNGKIKADGLDLTNGNQVVHLASGTENRIPKFSSNAGELQNSTITETEGNVGIGTLSPATKMEIKATGNDAALLTLNAEAQAAKGIQITDNGTLKWKIAKEANSDDLVIGDGSLVNSIRIVKSTTLIGTYEPRVVIGEKTVSPANSNQFGSNQIKLSVDGVGVFKEIAVLEPGQWADYVFDKNYKLLTLDSVETFVNQKHHLPDVPSASEVAQNGLKIGEMNTILLRKIEELTLYVIELKKELNNIKSK